MKWNQKNRIASWLTVLSVLLIALITVGGAVRNLGAGLSCPDWPLCHGKIIPHFDIRIFAEYFHRVFASLVGFFTIGLAFVILRKKELRALLGRLAFMSIIILMLQVLLGGLTVLHLLQSEIVTLHLAVGTLYFAVVLIMCMRAFRFGNDPALSEIKDDKSRNEPPMIWRIGIGAIITLYIQIILGGIVSSHYAGLACPDFPTCLGEWWPGFAGISGIHFLHRVGAVITFTVISYYIFRVLKSADATPSVKSKIKGVGVLLVLQILLGIGNVVLRLPVVVSVGHLAIAQCLFALILITTYEIRHGKIY